LTHSVHKGVALRGNLVPTTVGRQTRSRSPSNPKAHFSFNVLTWPTVGPAAPAGRRGLQPFQMNFVLSSTMTFRSLQNAAVGGSASFASVVKILRYGFPLFAAHRLTEAYHVTGIEGAQDPPTGIAFSVSWRGMRSSIGVSRCVVRPCQFPA